MSGFSSVKRRLGDLSVLYSAYNAVRNLSKAAVKIPYVLAGSFLHGIMESTQKSKVILDGAKLTRAEAETESELDKKHPYYSDQCKGRYAEIYWRNKKKFDDLSAALEEKTMSQLLEEGIIKPDMVFQLAMVELSKSGDFVSKDSEEIINSNISKVTAGLSVILKVIADVGQKVGSEFGKFIGGYHPDSADSIAAFVVVNKALLDISKESAKIPLDLFWTGVGGSIEGLSMFIRSLNLKEANQKTPFTLGSMKENFDRAAQTYVTEKRKVQQYDRVSDKSKPSGFFEKKPNAAKKFHHELSRRLLSDSSNFYMKKILLACDSVRATVRGCRRYTSEVTTGLSSAITKKTLEGLKKAIDVTKDGFWCRVDAVRDNFNIFSREENVQTTRRFRFTKSQKDKMR